jgi:hypothetical protein
MSFVIWFKLLWQQYDTLMEFLLYQEFLASQALFMHFMLMESIFSTFVNIL